jgi:hypothetical protein
MEQLRPILAGLKKHHFWILSVVSVLVMLYCWNSATSDVKKQFQANQIKVKNEFGKMAALAGQKEKPSASWEAQTNEKTNEVSQKADTASKAIINSQVAALAWNTDSFGAKFVTTANTTPPEEWDNEMIQWYVDGMQKELVRLRKVMGATDGMSQEGVQWDSEDYKNLEKGINALPDKSWNNPGDKNRIHHWRKVIWLYENMARIVGITNQYAKDAGVFDPFNPPIHTVVKLQIPENWTGTREIRIKGTDWKVRGAGPIVQKIVPPKVPGYQTFAVAMQFRMDAKRIGWLQTACANSQLPIDILGFRFEKPRRLKEVEPPEDERRRVRPGGRAVFPGRARVNQKQPAKDAAEEENKPKYGRGTLVEIYGIVYIAETEDVDTKTVAKPKPAGAAVVSK